MAKLSNIPTAKKDLYDEVKRILDKGVEHGIMIWLEDGEPFFYPFGKKNKLSALNLLMDSVKLELLLNLEGKN